MTASLAKAVAAVERLRTVRASVTELLTRLATELRNSAQNPAAVVAIADSIDAEITALADSVVANTPVANEPPTP